LKNNTDVSRSPKFLKKKDHKRVKKEIDEFLSKTDKKAPKDRLNKPLFFYKIKNRSNSKKDLKTKVIFGFLHNKSKKNEKSSHLPNEKAKWLNKRIKKSVKNRDNKSKSLILDNNFDIDSEREKIIESIQKQKSPYFDTDNKNESDRTLTDKNTKDTKTSDAKEKGVYYTSAYQNKSKSFENDDIDNLEKLETKENLDLQEDKSENDKSIKDDSSLIISLSKSENESENKENKTPLSETKKEKEENISTEYTNELKLEEKQEEITDFYKTNSSFEGKPEELERFGLIEEESIEDSKVDKENKNNNDNINIEDIKPDGHIEFLERATKLKKLSLEKLGISLESWYELDFYPLEEPFSYVEIIQEKTTLDKQYVLVEVNLYENENLVLEFLIETLSSFSVDTTELDEKGEESYLIENINQIIDDYSLKIDEGAKKKIIYFLKKRFLGLGKLETLMKDSQIEDISCDGSNIPLFVYHRRYGSLKSNVLYEGENELSDFVMRLAQKCGKHISIAEPMLDATMPDGSRLQMTLSTEVTTKGSTFTIRKFKEDPFSPPDLIEFNTMSNEMVAYLWLAVENGINALVAGGTAAGKTSTLNAFCLFIPKESKIVSIEETREINLPHPNWIPGVSRSGFGEVVGGKVVGEIDLYDLMKAALRQRPEFILVGEIRGREAYVLFQAMATGHTTYSTVHADSAASLIHRLEGKPIDIPRIMLQALDIVCIQIISRIKNKRARRCKQIIEIIDIDPTTKEILTNEVFRWDPVNDTFSYNGKSYILERIRAKKDISREEMSQELKRRAELLEWMNKNNIREFKKVAKLIAQYTENPQQLIKKIQEGKLV